MRNKLSKEEKKALAAKHAANAKAEAAAPKPVDSEGRACFGLKWFATEAEADAYAAMVVARGDTYWGGFFHGMPCGRDSSFDYVVTEEGSGRGDVPVEFVGKMLFAVSTR
jgi:hypothetical protein